MSGSINDRDEAALDALLAEATAPLARDGLKDEILAVYNVAQPRGLADVFAVLFGTGMPYRAAGALAGLAALGFVTGIMTNSPSVIAPETELYAYVEDALVTQGFNEEGALLWAEE